MYFYTERGRRGYVSATDLAKFIFCPRFFLLSKLLPKRRTEALERGRKLHEEAFEKHRKKAIPLDLERALELGRERRVEGREVWVSDGLVHGIIDRLIIDGGEALVIEYKSGRSVESPVSRNQAMIYGVLIGRFLDKVIVEVRDFDERVYARERIEESHRELVERAVIGYRIAVARGIFPGLEDDRCELCPLREVCKRFREIGLARWL